MSARECVIPVFVPHLGCPHQCVFCDQRRISGAERSADAETWLQELTDSYTTREGFGMKFAGR